MYPTTYVIVEGDFNARLGKDDKVLFGGYDFCPLSSKLFYLPHERLSKDTKSNYVGCLLDRVASVLDLKILNGSHINDHPGEYIYWSGIRLSIIDYILISGNLAPRVESFEVSTYSGSDHIPLTLIISIPSLHPPAEDCFMGNNRFRGKHVSIKWDDQKRKYLQEYLR